MTCSVVDRRPCFLLTGRTGAGKTSLIQRLLGRRVVPDDLIGHSEPTTPGFEFYENRRYRVWDTKGFENEDSVYQAYLGIRDHSSKEFMKNRGVHIPHFVMHCIPGCGSRVTRFDVELLGIIPLFRLALLTQSDRTAPEERDGLLAALARHGIPPEHVICTSARTGEGLSEVRERVTELLPVAEEIRRRTIASIEDALTRSS